VRGGGHANRPSGTSVLGLLSQKSAGEGFTGQSATLTINVVDDVPTPAGCCHWARAAYPRRRSSNANGLCG
jgi:hypothetical protein